MKKYQLVNIWCHKVILLTSWIGIPYKYLLWDPITTKNPKTFSSKSIFLKSALQGSPYIFCEIFSLVCSSLNHSMSFLLVIPSVTSWLKCRPVGIQLLKCQLVNIDQLTSWVKKIMGRPQKSPKKFRLSLTCLKNQKIGFFSTIYSNY